jgi:3-isopropylmalate dehydratase small subunit
MTNSRIIKGRVWKCGDNIDTDIIMPSQYLSLPLDDMYQCAFEPLREGRDGLCTGDIIVAGKNFGCGSSREQAPQAIRMMGVKVIIAGSFARIFYRNALNIGLYPIESPEASAGLAENDLIRVSVDEGMISTEDSRKFQFTVFPEYVRSIVGAGGLVNYMKRRNREGESI